MRGDEGTGGSDPAAVAKRIHVPTYEEILERIKSRYPGRAGSLYEREQAALQRVFDVATSKTDFVKRLAALLDSLHAFHWRLIEVEFDRERIHRAVKCVGRARRIAARLYNKYRYLLMAAGSRREVAETGREARGRILSLFKKCRGDLDYLRDLVVFIQQLPAVDASAPTIIVAGAPNSGKSTLVGNVTRAKPRIAPYPFTTTTIHIGHYELDGARIQVIDTPGLLDRPVEEMNEIERKAVAALSELDGAIIFLVDVSPEAYMSVERQFNLLGNVRRITGGKPIYVALNKIDAPDPASLEKARSIAARLAVEGVVAGVYETATGQPERAVELVASVASRLTGLSRRP